MWFRMVRGIVAVVVAVCIFGVQLAAMQLTPEVQAMLDRITANSLRGHLSFIASDALEGRDTPSVGLDIAAEYIAAQFRRAGLAPAGDDGYFQTATFVTSRTPMDAFELKIKSGPQTVIVTSDKISFNIDRELKIVSPVFKVDYNDAAAFVALKPEQIAGKIVMTEIPDPRRETGPRRVEMFMARQEFLTKMGALNAALVISVDRQGYKASVGGPGRLFDPADRRSRFQPPGAPVMTVHDPNGVKFYDSIKVGLNDAEIQIHIPAPVEIPVRLRNVIGVLSGSDPVLKDTYVLLTAHYDHEGVRPDLVGDKIMNGANDDGSGTVSVIELAASLSAMKQRPKRSIVFMTFFGEEKGLLGSRYYGRHPIFPIAKTVGDINLEQLGRTDSDEGPQISNATMTGFDFTDIGTTLEAAGKLTGIKVYKHATNSDAFFSRSDNQALADQGVPAHTLCTAFVYPDYHGVGDHWDKIDYDNMEKVDRMVALGLLMIANNPEPPKWNEANPKTARYVKAWNEHHTAANGNNR